MKKQKGFNAYSSNFGGRGWFLVIFSLVTHYLVTASVNTMNITAGVFGGAHGWSTTTLFSFQTIAGWVAVFTMFLSGHLAQKYSFEYHGTGQPGFPDLLCDRILCMGTRYSLVAVPPRTCCTAGIWFGRFL